MCTWSVTRNHKQSCPLLVPHLEFMSSYCVAHTTPPHSWGPNLPHHMSIHYIFWDNSCIPPVTFSHIPSTNTPLYFLIHPHLYTLTYFLHLPCYILPYTPSFLFLFYLLLEISWNMPGMDLNIRLLCSVYMDFYWIILEQWSMCYCTKIVIDSHINYFNFLSVPWISL